MSNTNFACRLREERERSGLSQYALAKMAGLTKQALSRLELGEREPNWKTVQLLAHALGVSCETFVDPSVKPPATLPSAPRGRPRKATAGQGEPAAAKDKQKRGKRTGDG